jgi:hypothetical protein
VSRMPAGPVTSPAATGETRGGEHEVTVRVRSEFAARYPELAKGVWMPASEFAEAIVARAIQARRQSIHRRTLDPRHFEFRGASLTGGGRRSVPRRQLSASDRIS